MISDLEKLSHAGDEDENFNSFLFYDIEVFEKNTIIVFKDINYNTVSCLYNGSIELENEEWKHTQNFSDELKEVIKDKVLVGYNNYHYDDIILSAMVNGAKQHKIKEINDDIFRGAKAYSVNKDLLTLDCFQQINVAKSSLKKVEANIGMDIEETAVDFNIETELNRQQLEDTIKYCSHDVTATINVFKLRWNSYFVAKLQVTSMLPKDQQLRALRWNTTTITANLLTEGKKLVGWPKIYLGNRERFSEEELLNIKETMFDIVPAEVADNWSNPDIKTVSIEDPLLDCNLEFGQGGLHGVPRQNIKTGYSNVILLDVTSLYPNIILHLNALRGYTNKYKEIVDKRVAIKHEDPILSNALKLVINSTYGLMKNQYSKIKNERAALSVCIYGQIILYHLCVMLSENGYRLININTDGVAFNVPKGSTIDKNYMDIKAEWEELYGFELEVSDFDKWIQKDVNNYIAVKDDYIKVKGGLVNHYHDPLDYSTLGLHDYAGVTWSGTNSLGIIHRVLVDILTSSDRDTKSIQRQVDHYIHEDKQPILFQYILQAGNTYIGVFDKDGNQYQKVNRVFATKNEGVTLLKHKEIKNKEGETVISKQNFPNAPQNMYVFNKDLKDFDEFEDIIDTQYYVKLIEEKLELWE